jgi:hypothetical protein
MLGKVGTMFLREIDENVLREALERHKRLCVGFNKETGEKLYRPAAKLSK